MKRLWLFYLLLPVSGFAQDGERFLKSCASMLAINRTAPPSYFFAAKREQGRLDTLATSAQNYRSRAFNYVWQHDYEQAAVWLEKTASLYPKEHGMVGEIYLSTFS